MTEIRISMAGKYYLFQLKHDRITHILNKYSVLKNVLSMYASMYTFVTLVERSVILSQLVLILFLSL